MVSSSPLQFSKLVFHKKDFYESPYVINSHIGSIPDIFGEYRVGKHKGQPYVLIEPTKSDKIKFNYVVLTKHKKLGAGKFQGKAVLSGINLTEEYPTAAWGDFKKMNLVFLFNFKENFEILEMYVFPNAKYSGRSLFEKWQSGRLDLTIPENKISLPKPEVRGIRYSDGSVQYFAEGATA